VEDDTTLVFIEALRDKLYFTFQGIPTRVVLSEPWPIIATAAVIVNLVAVTISCFVLCLSTVPEVAAVEEARLTLFAVETVTIVWFIFDYAIRFFTARIRMSFFLRPANLLDLLTIVPYFVELTSGQNVSALAAFRVIRLTRVMRLARLSRTSGGLRDVVTALKNSGPAMSLLIFLLLIALTIAATCMYYAEQLLGTEWDDRDRLWIRADGHISPYQSIYHCMWWCIVTMTTVGYGDDVPINVVGKIVGVVTMFAGVLVIAFPTVILSATFHEAYSMRLTYMTLQKIAQMNGRLVSLKRRRGGKQAAKEAAEEDVASRTDTAIAGKWKRRHTFFNSSSSATLEGVDATGKRNRKEVIFFDQHDAFMEAYDMSPASVSRLPLECEFANPAEFDRNLNRIKREKEAEAKAKEEKLRRRQQRAKVRLAAAEGNGGSPAPSVVAHGGAAGDESPTARHHQETAALLSTENIPGLGGSTQPSPLHSPNEGGLTPNQPYHSFRGDRFGSMRRKPAGSGLAKVVAADNDEHGLKSGGGGVAASFDVLEVHAHQSSPSNSAGTPAAPVDIPSQSMHHRDRLETPSPREQQLQQQHPPHEEAPDDHDADDAPLLAVDKPPAPAWEMPHQHHALDYLSCATVRKTAATSAAPALSLGGEGQPALSSAATKEAHEAWRRRMESIVSGSHLTNRGAQNQDTIINGVLFYAPVLQLACVPLTNVVKAKVVKTYPAGYTLTVNLILDSEVIRSVYEAQYVPKRLRHSARKGAGEIDGKRVEIRSKKYRRRRGKGAGAGEQQPHIPGMAGGSVLTPAEAALDDEEDDDQTRLIHMGRKLQRAARRMGQVHAVAVKKLRTLKVMLTHKVPLPLGDLVSTCYMAVDCFEEPHTSQLPLTVVAPTKEAFKALIENFELLTFQFSVEYNSSEDVAVDLGNIQIKSVVRTKEGAGGFGAAPQRESFPERLKTSRRPSAVPSVGTDGLRSPAFAAAPGEETLAVGDGTAAANPFAEPPQRLSAMPAAHDDAPVVVAAGGGGTEAPPPFRSTSGAFA
jgi:hypothetical protein